MKNSYEISKWKIISYSALYTNLFRAKRVKLNCRNIRHKVSYIKPIVQCLRYAMVSIARLFTGHKFSITLDTFPDYPTFQQACRYLTRPLLPFFLSVLPFACDQNDWESLAKIKISAPWERYFNVSRRGTIGDPYGRRRVTSRIIRNKCCV